MGYKEIEINLPTAYTEDQLKQTISKTLRFREFSYQIENKSLDARKKSNIHWLVRVGILSKEIKGDEPAKPSSLNIPHKKRKERKIKDENNWFCRTRFSGGD